MSASFSKHGLAPVLSNTISVAGGVAFAGAERRPSRRSFRQVVGRAFSAIRGRSAVFNELNSLSERELADIGLSRADIPRVFDPAFAAEHAARG